MLKNSYQARSVSDRGRTVYTMWLYPSCKERVHDLGFGIQPAKMQSFTTDLVLQEYFAMKDVK